MSTLKKISDESSANGTRYRFERSSKANGDSKISSKVKTLSTNLAINNGVSFGGAGANKHRNSSEKPQFYFGQNLNSLVKMSPFLEHQQHQLARRKKSPGSHPKFPSRDHLRPINVTNHSDVVQENFLIEEKEKRKSVVASLTSATSRVFSKVNHTNGNGHNSRFYDDGKEDEDETLPQSKVSFHLSSTFSKYSMKRMTSTSPTRRNVDKSPTRRNVDKSPMRRNVEPMSVEKSQEQLRKEFEAELIEGKLRLRKVSNDNNVGNNKAGNNTVVNNNGVDSYTMSNRRQQKFDPKVEVQEEDSRKDEIQLEILPETSNEDVEGTPMTSLEEDEEGLQCSTPPPAIPPPPPPPPPPLRSSTPINMKASNGDICPPPPAPPTPPAPPAPPKLPLFGTSGDNKRKVMVAPNGLNARWVMLH
jgi:hypothetical protein